MFFSGILIASALFYHENHSCNLLFCFKVIVIKTSLVYLSVDGKSDVLSPTGVNLWGCSNGISAVNDDDV